MGEWNESQSRFLPGIAEMAKEGRGDFVTYWLIDGERLYNQRVRTRTVMDYDHFEGVRFRSIDHPFVISGVALPRIGLGTQQELQSYLAMQIEFNREPRFIQFLEIFGKKNSFDAHHLWFSEKNHIDYFVTADRKLLRKCKEVTSRKSKRMTFSTIIVSPAEFAEQFAIAPSDPSGDIDIAW